MNNQWLCADSIRYYLEHALALAPELTMRVNKEICDSDNNVVLTRGDCLTAESFQTFCTNETLSHGEFFFDVSPCFSANTLFETCKKFAFNDSAFLDLLEYCNCGAQIKIACDYCERFPVFLQTLTLLEKRLDGVFKQSLFGVWIGIAVMAKAGRPQKEMNEFFLACLAKDLGWLFLPGRNNNPIQCSKPSIEDFHAHVHLSYAVLACIEGMPKVIIDAVLEHHEHLDGTGYPLGKNFRQVSFLGQQLQCFDSLSFIYYKRLHHIHRPLSDLWYFIKMNGHNRFGTFGKTIMQFLECLPECKQCLLDDTSVSEAVYAIKEKHVYVHACAEKINELSAELGFLHERKHLFLLQNAIIHINVAMAQTGIIDASYIRWLSQVADDKLCDHYKEVEDASLMFAEVIYHIHKLLIIEQSLINSDLPNKIKSPLTKNLCFLKELTAPKIDKHSALCWLEGLGLYRHL